MTVVVDNRYAPAILAEEPVVTCFLRKEYNHRIPPTSNILSVATGDF